MLSRRRWWGEVTFCETGPLVSRVGKRYAPEPLVRGAHEAGQMALDILNIVQLGRERVLDVDDKDLPVGLAFIKKGHDAEDFDLLNLPYVTHLFADLADIQRIVVAISLGLGVLLSGILPSLQIHTR